MQLNRALQHLAALPQREPAEREQFTAALAAFLAAYGHRSFSLDLRRPGFGADVDQVYELLAGLRESPHEPKSVPLAPAASDRAVGKSRSRLAEGLLSPLARLARRYARLREDQRFAWQRGLALLRRLYCLAGGVLVAQGSLQRADEVFFLTATEVRQAASGAPPDLHAVAHTRQQHFEEDWARFRQDARASYPPFLRGDAAWEPVTPGAAAIETRGGPTRGYRGEPVSPGIGRGPARVVLRPEDLTAIQPGDVLVTRGADPGWTVVFDRLAGLVTESGGQLSHAAVVAREYGLPAVVAVARATELIRSGEPLLVDGTAGLVQKAEPT
jgi:phosphohistidine swiveling domain-containing protein